MRICITGGKGMLGRTLERHLSDCELLIADLPGIDMTRPDALAGAFAAFHPDCVIHCAAMTKVDDCEANSELAYSLNETGSRNVAEACRATGARLIAISTDYVFGGEGGGDDGYGEDDAPAPRTVYGASKLAGERAIMSILPDAAILRIAWLYGAGGPSFVHTMAKLGAQPGPPLKVVNDQRGNPTSTDAVASAIRFILDRPDVSGVLHGTCEGSCTWYDLTVELFRLLKLERPVQPCTTAEFPRPAPRPADSALANRRLEHLGFRMPHWKEALSRFVQEEFLA